MTMVRKLIVSEFLTLDGVMQAPGDVDEDREGGFKHGGWQDGLFDDDLGGAIGEIFDETDALLLGRKTYDLFADFWPTADDAFAAVMNGMPKYVATTTLTEPLAWQNTTLLKGDVADAVAALKNEPGKAIQVIGSSVLVQSLAKRGLVDEYRLQVHPIVIGSGKRLFGETDAPMRLRLSDSRTTPKGVLILTYEPIGEAAAGETRAPEAAGARG
jgi:dihydrofolate reductase